MESASLRPRPVLLVEDQPDDALLFELAFRQAELHHRLVKVKHGGEAISYLSDQQNPPPCVLITDLKMPVRDGFDLLTWIKERGPQPDYPIIVFSSSNLPSDVERALSLGAHEFCSKPIRFGQLVNTVRNLKTRFIEPHCSKN